MVNDELSEEHGHPDSEAQESGNDVPSEFPQSEEKKWKAEERHHRRIERRYWRIGALLTGLTTIAAIVAAVFAGWALKASWESLAESIKATAEAHRQADEAHRQAVAAESANRALIAVDAVTFDGKFEKNKPFIIVMNYENVGHEAAVDVQTKMSFDIIPTDADPGKSPINTGKQFSCDFINTGSGGNVAFPIVNHQYNGTHIVGAEYAAQDVFDNKAALILRGCITYTSLGVRHLTQVCAVVAKGTWRAQASGVSFCEDGNLAW